MMFNRRTLAFVFLSFLLATPVYARGNPFGDRGWCAYPAARGKARGHDPEFGLRNHHDLWWLGTNWD